MWYVVAVEGPDTGRTFAYVDDHILFGRAGTPDYDLQLPTDAYLSREHATIQLIDAGIRIELCDQDPPSEPAVVAWDEAFTLAASRFRATGTPPPHPEARLEESPDLPRRQLDDFDLVEECGSGASARVYLATDKTTGERLAIKRFRKELFGVEPAMALFVREMEIHAHLRHPHIVRTLCVGRDRSELFIGMDWIEGCNLSEYVDVFGCLGPQEVCRVGLQLLAALEFTHAQGLIHRDIKPSNVMVPTSGEMHTRLVDFGLARHLRANDPGSTLTYTGDVRGTLDFSPPECLLDAKRAKATADVFSVGTTLYYALTGRLWFDDDRLAQGDLPAIREFDIVPLAQRDPTVPEPLARVVEGAIHLAPEDRWPSATDMARELRVAAAAM